MTQSKETQPAGEVGCCPLCDDGDGQCAYPYYGAAPHRCGFLDGLPFVGSSTELPAEEWPANFVVDPECGPPTGYPRAGTYTHCLACGAPTPRQMAHEQERA